VKQPRPPADPDSSKAAYFRALRWLTARELSETQVRTRLAEKGYTETAIKPAVERLLHDRTIDDRRAALAVARTEAGVRRHGPHRVMSKLIAMRIDRDLAKDVVRELFGEEDEDALIDKAIERRLRGNTERLRDPKERQKLIAYLVRQGFSASNASAALRRARSVRL
jgi:regulatory protein